MLDQGINQSTQDHDLLIELRTEMRGVRDDIQKLTDGTAKQIADHELRLRFVEKYVWGAIAILGVVNFIGFAGVIYFLTLRHQ